MGISRCLGLVEMPFIRGLAEPLPVYMSRFENDLSARMTLFQLSIGLAYLGQRIDLRDRDLEPVGRDQLGKLPQHGGVRGFIIALGLHAVLRRSREVDDCIDSIRSDAQLNCQFDVPSAEGVNEGIHFTAGRSPDPIFYPITIGNGNYAVIGELRFASLAKPITLAPAFLAN
jgi:hypothetical protein